MQFKLAYTRLNVSDFQKSRNFYRDILGLSLAFEDEWDGYCEFATGNVRLTLFDRKKLWYFVKNADNNTSALPNSTTVLTFVVKNLSDAIDHLKKSNIEILGEPVHHREFGFKSAYFKDPDGNIVSLEEKTDVTF